MGKQTTLININLTPLEELENARWYLPDLGLLLLFITISFASVQMYLGSQELKIELLQQKIAEHQAVQRQIRGEVLQYDELSEKISKLESKKNSLLRITDSKLLRYLPVILIENLQNLKPKGLWFTRVAFVEPAPSPANNENQNIDPSSDASEDIQMSVEGSAFNKIIIAEFMTALKATQNQALDTRDVRTQVYFDDVSISFAEMSTLARQGDDGTNISDFRLILTFKERTPESILAPKLGKNLDEPEKRMVR